MIRVPNISLDDVDEFIDDYFPTAGATLLIGNVGFSPDVLYFPERLGPLPNVDMRFFHEKRPAVPVVITQLAAEREQQLRDFAACPMQVVDVRILAEDGAPVGGRNFRLSSSSTNCRNTLRFVCICWWPTATKPSQTSSRYPTTAAAGCMDSPLKRRLTISAKRSSCGSCSCPRRRAYRCRQCFGNWTLRKRSARSCLSRR